jgi:hypothetical protein
MRVLYKLKVIVFCLILTACHSYKGKHLVILSGQSNMVHLDPKVSLIPELEKEFGADSFILVKQAKGTQPISRWYKNAKAKPKETQIGDLYDTLMLSVQDSIKGKTIKSVSFLWMQGERDAKLGNAEVYENYLLGLYRQLSEDLKRNDINFVIGRLNDFDMTNTKWPHWTRIRGIQVKVAESSSNFDWVNTDEFNTGEGLNGNQVKDDIHMSKEGYRDLGKAFAEKTITLINSKN